MNSKTKDTIIRHLKGIVAALGDEKMSFMELSNKQLKEIWAIGTGNGATTSERQKLLYELKEEMKSRNLL